MEDSEQGVVWHHGSRQHIIMHHGAGLPAGLLHFIPRPPGSVTLCKLRRRGMQYATTTCAKVHWTHTTNAACSYPIRTCSKEPVPAM